MSLTTSVGFSAPKLLDPVLVLGPRSTAKLMMASPPVDFDVGETGGFHNEFGSPQVLELKTVELVTKLPDGLPGSDLEHFADLVVVDEASLDMGSSGPESDYHAFEGLPVTYSKSK